MMNTAPLLSIGIIFKNEERCLERCLKSLQPLRDAIPCELVMADTGATDGSRAIAARYADEVFDFEWIDDFAAARNAVMDRCTGKWYLTIDCDEWLDEDISELLDFLKKDQRTDFAFVIQRNYDDKELEKSEKYQDFFALRLTRMAAGHRYRGTIHESWPYKEPGERLSGTILHHDGYYFSDAEQAGKKQKRNMALLRKKLQAESDRLRTLLQCIESGRKDPDFIQYVRRAVAVVREKRDPQWKYFGAAIMRHAAEAARLHEMEELQEWIEFAEKQFPDSIFTKIDLSGTALIAAHDAEEWEKAIRYGENYRTGIRLLHAEKKSKALEDELGISVLTIGNPVSERAVLIALANAYLQNKQGEKALEVVAEIKGDKLDPGQVRNMVLAIGKLHAETSLDITSLVDDFYEQIGRETPNAAVRNARLAAFKGTAALLFSKAYQDEEKAHDGYHRPACTAFRCLAEQCEAGRAAAIIMTNDPAEIRSWLAQVEDWQALPIEALEHALQAGVAFPMEQRTLNIEIMDGLAARLAHDGNLARQMALALSDEQEYPDLQSLYWAQSLVLAALRSFDWTLGKNDAPASKFACPEKKKDDAESKKPEDTPETGLVLLRRFAQAEAALLPIFYTPQALAEENVALLPPMHRWGLYCALAFEALDADRPQEYLAVLRRSLSACPGQKELVQFLLDRFLENTRLQASPEQLMLAQKVKNILAAYDPADPAVTTLKASPAYQQVAWILEGTSDLPALEQQEDDTDRGVGRRVRAVFFAEMGEKWDAMQSVYETMCRDPRFDPVVVRTPVIREVKRDGKQEQDIQYEDFLTPMGISSLGYNEYDIAADRPDLAFISQPYGSCSLPQFRPENIAKYTHLVYLPYYLPDMLTEKAVTTLAKMPVYEHAWKVVCANKKHYAFYCRHAANKGANALVTGLPKTDPITALKENPPSLPTGWETLKGKTVFLWNTWYVIAGSAVQYFDKLTDWFDAHPDCALIWRPHPLCQMVTKLYYPDLYPTYQAMLRWAENAENIVLDRETSCFAAFSASHAMISDFSSLLPQYLLMDKPALWFRNAKFHFISEEIVDSCWMERADRLEDALAFFDRIRNGEDRNAALRSKVRQCDLALADGHCGERVCAAVWNALQEEDGLKG